MNITNSIFNNIQTSSDSTILSILQTGKYVYDQNVVLVNDKFTGCKGDLLRISTNYVSGITHFVVIIFEGSPLMSLNRLILFLGSSTLNAQVSSCLFDSNTNALSPPLSISNWYNGQVLIDSSTFVSNINTNGNGGAVSIVTVNSVSSNVDLVVSGSTFQTNYAGGTGGSVYTSALDSVIISKNNFNRNSALISGGAVFAVATRSFISIEKSNFIGNNVIESGSAVYVDTITSINLGSTGTLTVQNTNFVNNTNSVFFDGQGGGIFAKNIPSIILSVVVMDGNVNSAGGGMFMYSGQKLFADNLTCQNNNASSSGGCIGVSSKSSDTLSVVIKNSVINNNFAQSLGGGFSFVGHINVTLSSSSADSNKANFEGGFALLDKGSSITTVSSTISNSLTLNGDGGAFSLGDMCTLNVGSNSNFNSNIARRGGVVSMMYASSFVNINGDNAQISNNQANFGAVVSGLGFVNIGAGAYIVSNNAGALVKLGDSSSQIIGFGGVFYFSGTSPPIIPPSLRLSDTCRYSSTYKCNFTCLFLINLSFIL